MNITFGIITDGNSDEILEKTLDSIFKLNIPFYEIIVIGNTKIEYKSNFKKIHFDENVKLGWITKKKNLITLNASYDFVVYMHDYYSFDVNWYVETINFGIDFDICMNRIENLDGTRYHDWCLWVDNNSILDPLIEKYRVALIPYRAKNVIKYMYIPGGYWIARKEFMRLNPLNEELCWGEGEDVEWSKRIRNNARYTINNNAIVKVLKFKEPKFKEPNIFVFQIVKVLIYVDKLLRKYRKFA